MVSLTGGPRPFDREGFRLEEETNWRRAELLVASGIARQPPHRLPPRAAQPGDEPGVQPRGHPPPHQRAPCAARSSPATRCTGRLAMPLLTLHTTGDGQVPIEQLGILRRRVDAAGRQRLLASARVPRPGPLRVHRHRVGGGLEALVRWVEHGVRPQGQRRPAPERPAPAVRAEPAPGHPGGRRGSRARGAGVVVRGSFTLDGAPFDARFLGAVVLERTGWSRPAS